MKGFHRSCSVLCAALAAGPIFAQGAPAPENPQVSVAVSARPGERKAASIPPAGAEGVRLSLREAIEIALANNVDLQVAVAGSEAGRYGVLQAKGIFDPFVSADASIDDSQSPAATALAGAVVTKSRTSNGNLAVRQLIPYGGTFTLGWNNQKQVTNSSFFFVNPQYTTNAFLRVDQPLLRNFGIDATTRLIRIARNTEGVDDETFIRDVQQTIDSVEQAYWDLVYARENLKVKEESKALAEELYRITKIKIDVGSQAPIDIVQTEAGVAQRELDIITARSAVGDAEDRLKRLLNFASFSRWNDHVVPTDEVRVEPVALDVADGMTKALSDRPEIRSALYNASSARISYDFARNQTRPQLNLSASYGYSGLGGDTRLPGPDGETGTSDDVIVPGGYGDAFHQLRNGDFRQWSVGLNFGIPIFNRQARGARAAARWTLESSLASMDQLRQNITVEVRGAARSVETARESIQAAKKARELAEQNVDAEKKKYDNGLVTSFEVLQVQNDLSAARSAELQALTQYRNATVAYHLAVGDLLSWKDVRIEGITLPEVPEAASLQVSR
jgi:outer membrane protein TolC